MPIRYNTVGISERNQFTFWQEAVCEVFIRLDCKTDSKEKFQGDIILERLPRISISSVSSDKLTVNRRKTDIARSKDDCFLLNLQLINKSYIFQRDRRAELYPGDFAIYSSTDPYQLLMPDSYHHLVFKFPKSELMARLPNCELLTALKVGKEDEIGRFVADSLCNFSRVIGKSDEVMQHYLQDTILDLIATGLASIKKSTFELSQPEQYMLLRAKSFIHSNLCNPNLTREVIADAMGVSTRKLSNTFAKEKSTVARYIRVRRLERIARDLAAEFFNRQTISEIAFRWGFNNLQHFSKVFQKQYGLSPRDYRRQRISVRNT